MRLKTEWKSIIALFSFFSMISKINRPFIYNIEIFDYEAV